MRLSELRDSFLSHLKQEFPNVPEYVVKDLMYPNLKGATENDIDWFKKEFSGTWKLEQIDITLDVFDSKTQTQLTQRISGENPNQVSRDAERHDTQQQLLKKTGVSKEPIIVKKTPDGYALLEGWHRTIQHLSKYPAGYTAPAYVLYK